MTDEEMNLDFLNKLKEDLDNDVEVSEDNNDQEESKETQSFDIDNEEEAELDFDLNELISKIDAKMEELNNESTENDEVDKPKTIEISSDIDQDTTLKNDEQDLEELTVENVFGDALIGDIEEDQEKNADFGITREDNLDVAGLVNTDFINDKEDTENEKLNIDDSFIENSEIEIKYPETLDIRDSEDIKEEIEKETEEEINTISEDNKGTDINNLFEKVNSNVKEASDIFLKNVEMKKKLDKRFEELKELQRDIEKSKQSDYEEINKYKESVLEELTSKKNEIENRLNELKDLQASFEKEKNEFETYKKESKEEINNLAREQKVKDDSRKEELEALEDKLRKQKDEIDEEKRQLSLDRIKYEADKNDLANNMLKFNEIVGTFTDGVGNLN